MAVELRYTGRRTGREYALPVQYARDGHRLVVVPQGAESKTWWRNFLTPQRVSVRLNRHILEGTARVISRNDPAWQQARRLYELRWRRLTGQVTGPIVEITLEPKQ